jgi:hypothetical protein
MLYICLDIFRRIVGIGITILQPIVVFEYHFNLHERDGRTTVWQVETGVNVGYPTVTGNALSEHTNQGMQNTVLGPGGFAMMPSKQPHWFTCTAKEECLMFVSFDRPCDIVWLKANK